MFSMSHFLQNGRFGRRALLYVYKQKLPKNILGMSEIVRGALY